jgi:hypothetical protein
MAQAPAAAAAAAAAFVVCRNGGAAEAICHFMGAASQAVLMHFER